MRTWKMEVEYEGTRYGGWQRQPDRRTIQGELLRAADTFLDARVEVGGAGRTDAGVHALRQAAHLKINNSQVRVPPPAQLLRGINGLLPHDINLLSLSLARPDFHARHDARSRSYLYQIATRRTAFGKPFVWWVRDRLNARAMAEAAALIVGRHDFGSFCESPEAQGSTLVEVESARVVERGNLILFRVGASHFLWKMVRRLTGALVEVGRGNLSVGAFGSLLQVYSAAPAAWTAPPSGLFLERVLYAGERPRDEPASAFQQM